MLFTYLNRIWKASVFSDLHNPLSDWVNLKIPICDSVHFVLTIMLSVTILCAFVNSGGLFQ